LDPALKVLHLPGHTPGSLGLWEEGTGVLVTGDTLYETDGELVDWYPGASVTQMAKSIERLAALAPSVTLALPGHNGPLKGGSAVESAARSHLRSVSTGRKVRKTISRLRAAALLAARSAGAPLPPEAQAWMRG